MLEVKNLSVSFKMYDRKLNQIIKKAVHDISVDVKEGEIHAVVGSSGSGKSLLAHAVMDILPNNAIVNGKILINNDIMDSKKIAKLRGKEVSFIPQSISYLNPLMRIDKQIFGKNYDKKRQDKIFERFGFITKDRRKFPFQLSGGMARRVLIMSSVIQNSKLIIADEPTPGLNPQLATEILNVFRDLANEGKAILLITHDIDLVCEVADRISIFYGGTILETLTVEDFIEGNEKVKHPYTRALWSALPQNNFEAVSLDEIVRKCKEENFALPDNDNIFE